MRKTISLPVAYRVVCLPAGILQSSLQILSWIGVCRQISCSTSRRCSITSERCEGYTYDDRPWATGSPQSENLMSDATTVVYCRLLRLKVMTDDQMAYAVRTLHEIVDEALNQIADVEGLLESRSSVYGRFALIDERPQRAVELAQQVITTAAKKHIELAIGVAQGRVEKTSDVNESTNVAGNCINRAARLAFLQDARRIVAVEEKLVRHLIRASVAFQDSFETPAETKIVKNTEVSFQRLRVSLADPGEPPADPDVVSRAACAVAVDIVKYSEKDLAEQVASAEGLLVRCVRRAFNNMGGFKNLSSGTDWWYSPGGDGGVIVFRDGLAQAAWTFTQKLLDQCRGSIEVRIGVANGLFAIIPGEQPMGNGVLDADRFSGLPATGAIAVGKEFWNDSLESADKTGWSAIETDDDPDAFLLAAPGQILPSPKQPVSDGREFWNDSLESADKTSWSAGETDDDPDALLLVPPGQPLPTPKLGESNLNRDEFRSLLSNAVALVRSEFLIKGLSRLVSFEGKSPSTEFTDAVTDWLLSPAEQDQFDDMLGQLDGLMVECRSTRAGDEASQLFQVEDLFMQAHFNEEALDQAIKKMNGSQAVVLDNVFSGPASAEVAMSRLEGKPPAFRPTGMKLPGRDQAEPAGKALAAFGDDGLGSPSPQASVCRLLAAIVSELDFKSSVERFTNTEGSQKDFDSLCDLVSGLVRHRSSMEGRNRYCVVKLSKDKNHRDAAIKLLDEVRCRLGRIVFLELREHGDRAELVYVSSLRLRFENQ